MQEFVETNSISVSSALEVYTPHFTYLFTFLLTYLGLLMLVFNFESTTVSTFAITVPYCPADFALNY